MKPIKQILRSHCPVVISVCGKAQERKTADAHDVALAVGLLGIVTESSWAEPCHKSIKTRVPAFQALAVWLGRQNICSIYMYMYMYIYATFSNRPLYRLEKLDNVHMISPENKVSMANAAFDYDMSSY